MKQIVKEKQLPNQNSFVQIKAIRDENLPALLKETRKSLGLSLEEMAIILGTTERTCRRWELGESEASGQSIARIYKLRKAYPEAFFQPVNKSSEKEQEEETKLWLKELITELNQQQQKLIKDITLAISKNNTKANGNTNNDRNRSNDNPGAEELLNRLSRLEKRLTFLEEKCGYPYNHPRQHQHQQQSQYNQQYDNRNKRRR